MSPGDAFLATIWTLPATKSSLFHEADPLLMGYSSLWKDITYICKPKYALMFYLPGKKWGGTM